MPRNNPVSAMPSITPTTLPDHPPGDALATRRIVQPDGAVWEVCAAWEDHLFGPDAPDWFALENCSSAKPIKRGRDRTIWAVQRSGATLFVKVRDARRWRNILKQRTVGDAARREWRISQEAIRRGIPIVNTVAWGRNTGHPRRTVFVSRGLEGGERATTIWQREVLGATAHRRNEAAGVIHALAAAFARAHDRGFLHGDAHPNNILLRRDADERAHSQCTTNGQAGAWQAVFVDVHGARLVDRSVSRRELVAALAELDQYFHRCATRTERLRFLQRYLSLRTGLAERMRGAALRGLLTDLSRAAARHRRKLARRRDRRLRRNGRYFTTIELPDGWRATVALQLARRHVFPEPHVPDRNRAQWNALLSQLLTRIESTDADGKTIIHHGVAVECRVLGTLRERITARLAGSAHRRAFERCHRLRHRDVPTDLVLGCAERRRYALIDRTVLLRPVRG